MNPVEIVARREALGLSQVQLAALLGVAQNTVSAWERGKRNIPAGVHTDLESLEALQDELKVTAEFLFSLFEYLHFQ